MQLYVVIAEPRSGLKPIFVSHPVSLSRALSLALDFLNDDDCFEVSISRYIPSDDD